MINDHIQEYLKFNHMNMTNRILYWYKLDYSHSSPKHMNLPGFYWKFLDAILYTYPMHIVMERTILWSISCFMNHEKNENKSENSNIIYYNVKNLVQNDL